jgi:tRNA pseudouridine32 synthase / 23S rRNA pseudouridine746 synthase
MNPYNPPKDPHLDIIYNDEAILIANKPSGLLTVPGRAEHKKDCLISRITPIFPSASIVHRLDIETSGLVVMALDKTSQSSLGKSFQSRLVEKRYLAWVDGSPLEDTGSVDLPLTKDWPNRPLQKVDLETGKPSLTHWRVLDRQQDRSLLMLIPVTGRSHQLRVHMKELGHTILGDPLYADSRVRAMAPRLMLHAGFLSFPHPKTQDKVQFVLPPALTSSLSSSGPDQHIFHSQW